MRGLDGTGSGQGSRDEDQFQEVGEGCKTEQGSLGEHPWDKPDTWDGRRSEKTMKVTQTETQAQASSCGYGN